MSLSFRYESDSICRDQVYVPVKVRPRGNRFWMRALTLWKSDDPVFGFGAGARLDD